MWSIQNESFLDVSDIIHIGLGRVRADMVEIHVKVELNGIKLAVNRNITKSWTILVFLSFKFSAFEAFVTFIIGSFSDGSFCGRGPFVTGTYIDGTFCDGSLCRCILLMAYGHEYKRAWSFQLTETQ